MHRTREYTSEYIKFRIDYGGEPIELKELAKCFNALDSYYKRYIKQERRRERAGYALGESSQREPVLLIKSISEGSIEWVLVTEIIDKFLPRRHRHIAAGIALITLFKLMATSSILEDNGGKEDSDMYKNASEFVQSISIRDNAHLTINVVVEGDVIISGEHSSKNAQIIQQNLNQRINEIETTQLERFAKQVFYWHQVRSVKSRGGDRGVIKDIHDKPLPVLFNKQADKDRMLGHSIFTHDYVVDVQVSYRYGKPVEYEILAVRDSIPKY